MLPKVRIELNEHRNPTTGIINLQEVVENGHVEDDSGGKEKII